MPLSLITSMDLSLSSAWGMTQSQLQLVRVLPIPLITRKTKYVKGLTWILLINPVGLNGVTKTSERENVATSPATLKRMLLILDTSFVVY